MRAALLEWWPALSSRFGLMPWDLGRLSRCELDEYLKQLQDDAWRSSHG